MNLNSASDQELEQYREKVAGIVGLDPMMLDYIWVYDQETGLKNRVLYAKRGAAEIIRNQRHISVTSLTQIESLGTIIFTAIGSIPSGRQEIAVGSAYVEGHKADKKAHAVMTAQTRAVRRLTLQFVGGGILDETEVQTQTELMAQPAASAATLAGSPVVVSSIPTVAPAPAPGKDITPAPVVDKTVDTVATPVESKPIESTTSQPGEAATIPPAIAPKTRKPRKAKNTVSLGESVPTTVETPAQTEIPAGTIDTNGTITPDPAAQAAFEKQQAEMREEAQRQLAAKVSTPVPAATVPQPPPVEEKVQPAPPVQAQAAPPISPDKNKEYKDKFRQYSQDILVSGGMMSSEGIGGTTMKLRKFAITFAGVPDINSLTSENWIAIFDMLDKFVAQFGAKALVDHINETIGVPKP